MPGIIGRQEFRACVGVGDIITGIDDVLAIGAEHLQDILLHAGLDGGGERAGRIVRTGEGLLGLRRRSHQAQTGE